MDATGNDGNGSMQEQVRRPNLWREMMMMMIITKKFDWTLCFGLWHNSVTNISEETSFSIFLLGQIIAVRFGCFSNYRNR